MCTCHGDKKGRGWRLRGESDYSVLFSLYFLNFPQLHTLPTCLVVAV